jgi:hypothetical protein
MTTSMNEQVRDEVVVDSGRGPRSILFGGLPCPARRPCTARPWGFYSGPAQQSRRLTLLM